MAQVAEKTQGSERLTEIRHADLPLSCPRSQDLVWNMHPRVYLPIEEIGEVVCPYCGARYRLVD